jgi:hypothetical protein
MKQIGSRKLDFKAIAKGFGFKNEYEARKFCDDGRIMGRVGEFWHEGERQNENSPFDVKDKDGKRVEVRSITTQVSFASSKEVGYGRSVTNEGFEQKLNSLDSYLLLDLRCLHSGSVDLIEVSKDDLNHLPIGVNKSIAAKKFYEIYDSI